MARLTRDKREEQVANAPDDFPNLSPVSAAPAAATAAKWAALLPNQIVPLIWERRHADEQEL